MANCLSGKCTWWAMRGQTRTPTSLRGNGTRLNIISCTKTHKYLLKGHNVFLAHVTIKETEDKSGEKRLEDVPIVLDFPEVFPDLLGLSVYSKIDFTMGYHQLRVSEGRISKTAFRTRYGHYEYLVMPFAFDKCIASIHGPQERVCKPYLGLRIFKKEELYALNSTKCVFGSLRSCWYYQRFIEGFSIAKANVPNFTQLKVALKGGQAKSSFSDIEE
ncbi:hypothetical protein Tco_0772450 [Tanacetum coccineum]|uniref:Uncharacterized protein n=1 Tax=Tanacetum coccineum TaxID=301880 RepID=A0ABQ4ZHY3_9ASTR